MEESRTFTVWGAQGENCQRFTAVFTLDEDGWVTAHLAEWPEVVTCGRCIDHARIMVVDAAREMAASYRDEGREPPVGAGQVEVITIEFGALESD